jgi:hypothetical protein
MSGRRPDTTLTYNFKDNFRAVPAGRTPGAPSGSAWRTYPEYFKINGYNTTGCGKTYHNGHPKNFDQPYSWTEGVEYMGYNQGLCKLIFLSILSIGLSVAVRSLELTQLAVPQTFAAATTHACLHPRVQQIIQQTSLQTMG